MQNLSNKMAQATYFSFKYILAMLQRLSVSYQLFVVHDPMGETKKNINEYYCPIPENPW